MKSSITYAYIDTVNFDEVYPTFIDSVYDAHENTVLIDFEIVEAQYQVAIVDPAPPIEPGSTDLIVCRGFDQGAVLNCEDNFALGNPGVSVCSMGRSINCCGGYVYETFTPCPI